MSDFPTTRVSTLEHDSLDGWEVRRSRIEWDGRGYEHVGLYQLRDELPRLVDVQMAVQWARGLGYKPDAIILTLPTQIMGIDVELAQ